MSFTKAAERLGVAQPAVARYVSDLEGYIATSLFIRRNNKLTLTPEGRQLAEAVEEGLGRIQSTLSSIERRRRNKLVVAASFEFAHLWLMPRLSALRRKLEPVEPQILAADDYRDHHQVGVDLSVQFWQHGKAGNHSVLLFEESAVPAASPEFVTRNEALLAQDPSTWPAEWLIEVRPDGKDHLSWERWYAGTGSNSPALDGRQFHDTYLNTLDAMVAGEGLGLAVSQLADQHMDRGALVPVSEHRIRNNAGYYLLHERSNRRGEEIARSLAMLSAVGGQPFSAR